MSVDNFRQSRVGRPFVDYARERTLIRVSDNGPPNRS